tara:strand:+ start:692 stop:883 length:192 start_codon:yes stop_codon:yes gene_type:complete
MEGHNYFFLRKNKSLFLKLYQNKKRKVAAFYWITPLCFFRTTRVKKGIRKRFVFKKSIAIEKV